MRLSNIVIGGASFIAMVALHAGCSPDDDRDAGPITTFDAGTAPDVSDAGPGDTARSPDLGDAATDAGNGLGPWCTGQPDDFSFFVTSMDALWKLSNSRPGDLDGGFGGDFGGLAGADEICQAIGAATGHGSRTWRAFLSATNDGNGNPVHAIERIGEGPWTDANGRLVASGIAGLLNVRPDGDVESTRNLPDECGVPTSILGDAHDTVTGSNPEGELYDIDPASTCLDWTSSDGTLVSTGGQFPGESIVIVGHSFPRAGDPRGQHWLSDHATAGCGKGANLSAGRAGSCIGCGGGYGAIYCFAADQP